MKNKLFLWLSLLITVGILLYSCRNEDILNNEVTTYQRNNSDFFKHSKKGGIHAKYGVDYVDILEAYNKETDFLSTLPDQEGMPIWEKMQILDIDDKTVLYVPLSSDETSLSSLILVTLNENKEVSVLRDFTNDYLKIYAYNPEYPENKRRFLIDTFLQMDFLTFKQQRFTNLPIDLYNGATEYNQLNILDVTQESMSNGKFIYGSFCASIHACVNGCTLLTCDYNNCQHGGKCKVWKSCTNTVDWVDDPSSYPYNPSCGPDCGGGGGGVTPGSGGPRPNDPCAPKGGNKAFYRMMTGCGINTEEEDIFQSPCEKIKKIGKNAKTKALFENLKTKTDDTKEYAEILEDFGGQINNVLIEGEDGGDGVEIAISGGFIDGMLHSHYTGHLSIFSPGDLAVIAKLHTDGVIRDYNTFVLGVVTPQNTQYMMIIDDLSTFGTFAEQFITNGEIDFDFVEAYGQGVYYQYKIIETNSINDNELGFVRLLTDKNSGIKIFKGSNNSTTWHELTFENGQIVPKPCN